MIEFLLRRNKLPAIVQSERAECGLACLAMILCHHGFTTDLATLRREHPFSAMGTSLKRLIEVAARLELTSRALKAPLQALHQLPLPVILHWEMEHFVVLVAVKRDGALVINDPAIGRREIPSSEAVISYTGVLLELKPTTRFAKGRRKTELPLSTLFSGAVVDLSPLRHGLTLAMLSQMLALAVPKLGQFAIDHVAPSGSIADLNVIGVGFLFIAGCVYLAVLLRGLAFAHLGAMIHGHLARNLYNHMLKLPLSFFQRQHSSELTARMDSLRMLQRTLSVTFAETIVDGVTAIAALLLVAIDSPALAFASLICMATYAVIRVFGQALHVRLSEEQVIRAARVQTAFTETVHGIENVKAHGSELARQLNWDGLLVRWFNTSTNLQSRTALFSAALQALQILNFGACLWLGAISASSGQLSLGALLSALALVQLFSIRFGSLVDKVSEFGVLSVHRARLCDVLAAEPEANIGRGVESIHDSTPARLELLGISFSHQGTDSPIMSDLKLSVEPGDFIAITGPSGSGKTTLLRLMVGLYEPLTGVVRIDGQALSAFGKDLFRSQIGVVLQSDVLFSGTIADNICSFEPIPDQQLIAESARRAGIHDAIIEMPMRYLTLVGDMGSTLSGGQRQRLFLARALYRKPRILFLDEATSSLDVKKEREINSEIAALGITRIVFAHRLETIRSARRVLRLEGGALVELANKEVEAL